MSLSRRLMLVFGLLGWLVSGAAAGEIEPSFAHRLEGVDPNTTVAALVILRDRVDVAALDRTLTRMQATRRFRHEVIVTRLREKAAATQASLRALLEEWRDQGHDITYQAFWITNAIHLTAPVNRIAYVARRADVEVVYDGAMPVQIIQEVFFHGFTPPFNPVDGPEPGLVGIKATDLWALGYRGQGRLVANLDTGVDGNHPALKSRWRGQDPGVTPREAWHDPTNQTFPWAGSSHGTHVMGTICGLDGTNEIGVAPEARWIAAMWRWQSPSYRATFDADVISAFQWAADPDGDPGTVQDVPDAICNSWGLIPTAPTHNVTKCQNLYWDAIDNCEFSGCAVIFCAGNEGSRGAESLRVPADRIASPVSTFSVGALSTDQTTITAFSSRGPSGCDHQTVKPEVCAQGYQVRSCLPNNRYGIMSGTSMATPHVTGAVALLRQVWPHVTSERVKEILLETCDDLGPTGADNTYGRGRVNLLSAYQRLIAERPRVSIHVMGTVPVYKVGTDFWARVAIANNTGQPQAVRVSLQFTFENQPVGLVILPPTDIVLPAGFQHEPLPLPVKLPIPADLPASVLDPKTWSLRGEVQAHGGGALVHQSDYAFTITK